MDAKKLDLNLKDYEKEGLFLIFPDKSTLNLTKENIENTAKQYWNEADKIPENVKKAVEFQRCPFCPLKGKDEFCDAIRPILPFLGIVDKYVSFDKVMAVYKGDEKEIFHIADTTIQDALKYISLLSLMRDCQVGKKYYKYYMGMIPISRGREVTTRMYLNIYWIHKGNKEEISKIVTEFIEKIRITSQNQVKRMNLICKNDAFMNAFVNNQIVTEFLNMDIEKKLEESFKEFEKNIQIVQ